MTDTIFKDWAPSYWAADLPVIPLRPREKKPDIMQWSAYGSRMPSEIEMQHWLHSFPKGNIGLPLGPASGIAIDSIDTEDEALDAAIREICGPTPWVRVGQKGAALAYRFEGQKNFKLRAADGGMLCEFLGLGNQVVLPPSIHPKTQQPYTATADLWDVLEDLPYLGEDIEEKLRGLLGKKGYELGAGGRSSPIDIVPAGERDVQMVRHAGYLARVVLGIDKSTSFSLMEALRHMHHWVEHYAARVSGDVMDPEKGVSKLLEFLLKDLEKGRTMPDGWDEGLTDDLREHPTIRRLYELNADQRWTFTRAQKWFDDRVFERPDCNDWLVNAIESILQLVAKDDRFSQAHQNALQAHIALRCRKLGFTKRDVARMFTNARKGLGQGDTESHALIAAAVQADMHKFGEIRYDHGQFWQWNGSCFERLDEDTLYMHVANNVKDSALVRRHGDYSAIVQVLERMCKKDLVQAEERGINFANGFVDEGRTIAAHDPKYGATFTLPFVYNSELATCCPKWIEFLRSCWGHEADFDERVMALQEMFAATLFGTAPRYQRAFLLFGRAGTGKTQVLNVLRALLPPDAMASLGPQHWGEKFCLVDLIGKTANICGELPEKGLIAGNTFKEVVEGSPQRSEFKGEDGFVFVPRAAHWFASNYLPVSHDTTRGFIRRWLILDFNKPIRDEDKIEGLAEMLVAKEREAIAAWALEGLHRLIDQRGYTLPACHGRREHMMRRINNSVQAFLEDHPAIEPGDGSMKVQELYDIYAEHMRNYRRGIPVRFEQFMQMLEDLDLDVSRDQLGEYRVTGVVKRQLRAA